MTTPTTPPKPPTAHVLSEVLSRQDQILAELRHARARVPVRHGWLGLFIKDLETNPHAQFSVHKWGVAYWLANMPAVAVLFFFAQTLWLKWGVFIILEYSIYANLATDYGSMSSAMAAFGGDPLPAIPVAPMVEPPAGR